MDLTPAREAVDAIPKLQSMSPLLNIPIELLRKILEISVVMNGLDQAMMHRLVCRLFDAEIIHAICVTKAFERAEPADRYSSGKRLLLEYMVLQTLTDRAQEYHLTAVVQKTIDFILEKTSVLGITREEFVRILCSATINARFPQGRPEISSIHVILRHKRSASTTIVEDKASVLENALAAAAYLGRWDLFRDFMADGSQYCYTYFGVPVLIVADRGEVEMTQFLLNNGLGTSEIARGYLCRAVLAGHTNVARLLLDAKHLNFADEGDELVAYFDFVYYAVSSGCLNTVEFLMERATALEVIPSASPKLRELRIERSYCSSNTESFLVAMILRYAAYQGHEQIVRWALDRGASPNPIIRRHHHHVRIYAYPLCAAVRSGKQGIVNLLLTRGAHPITQRDYRGSRGPILLAVQRGFLGIAQDLISHGAEVEPSGTSIRTSSLLAAVKHGHLDCLVLLLQNRAVFTGAIGAEALSFAVAHGYSSIVEILHGLGVSVNSEDRKRSD